MKYITNLNDGLKDFQKDIEIVDTVGLDVEATTLDPYSARWILLQIEANNNTYIFDVRTLGMNNMKYIIMFLQDKICVGHNIKYDIKIIKHNTGVSLLNVNDTMLNEILINNGIGPQLYSLKTLVERYFQVELAKEIRDSFIDNPDVVITEELLIYSALDVKYLRDINEKQKEQLTKQKQMKIFDLESNLVPVVASMELNGIPLDADKWRELTKKAEKKIEEYEKIIIDKILEKVEKKNYKDGVEVCENLGISIRTKRERRILEMITEFQFIKEYIINNINIGSNKQLLHVLINLFEIEPLREANSTNEKIINKFMYDYPIIVDIINYREQQKLVSSFGEKFLAHINAISRRIHTNYNQLGARSGRFSSDDPNLQNITRNSEYRNCFVASPGYKIVAFDYSGQELRFIAKVADETKMIEAFNNGIDLHTSTASLLYEKSIDKITKSERSTGKALNFAVGYGSSEYGLYKNFNIPLEEGREYLYKYYNQVYTKLRDFKLLVGDMLLKKYVSQTLMGRKRFFKRVDLYEGGIKQARKYEEAIKREGINHIVQGSSGDCTKLALCEVFYKNPFGDKLRILLQVHDEIVCECPEEIAEEVYDFIKKSMLDVEQAMLGDEVKAGIDGYIEAFWKKE